MSEWIGALVFESARDGKAVFRFDGNLPLKAETRYMATLAEIQSAEPGAVDRQAVRRQDHGPSHAAETLCITGDFQVWAARELAQQYGNTGIYAPSPEVARRLVLQRCGIEDFEKLDLDENARTEFLMKIETPFYRYITTKKKDEAKRT